MNEIEREWPRLRIEINGNNMSLRLTEVSKRRRSALSERIRLKNPDSFPLVLGQAIAR